MTVRLEILSCWKALRPASNASYIYIQERGAFKLNIYAICTTLYTVCFSGYMYVCTCIIFIVQFDTLTNLFS